jgi:hypothetical protein
MDTLEHTRALKAAASRARALTVATEGSRRARGGMRNGALPGKIFRGSSYTREFKKTQ